ncbi:ATP-binding protein [Psychroflexus sp. YR1-1]|uniref:ATP-binding protein n=1 Tax=Psychroflexus aurantiacus TaxID=2709310 RepID=A0A6B3R156_9FLAO|nr:ATP-binding protein [Psychroflexus aurantiacus]NEV94339.1 ATP-binding protein [Psychroflexus aurantiacus]
MTKLKPVKNLLIGGPSTGKSTVLEALSDRGYWCFPEISREVTLEARQLGIEHLFLDEPLKFSEMLLKGRIKQFEEAETLSTGQVFIDRGIPDVTAYMTHFQEAYPVEFKNANENYRYDNVFLFPIWNDIYTQDNERFEDLELARNLQAALVKTYRDLNYELIEVPKSGIQERIEFILKRIQQK